MRSEFEHPLCPLNILCENPTTIEVQEVVSVRKDMGVSWCTTVSGTPWKKRDTDIAIYTNVINVQCNFLLCCRMKAWRWKESDGIHSLLHQTPLIKSTTLCGKEAVLMWKSLILQKMWSSLNDPWMWADGWGRARGLYALNRHLLGPHDFDWPSLSGSTHACISLKCSPCCEQTLLKAYGASDQGCCKMFCVNWDSTNHHHGLTFLS